MTKGLKGQKPYESEHPTRFWMPNVPGHQQKKSRIDHKTQEILKDQIKRLSKEIVEKGGNTERLS